MFRLPVVSELFFVPRNGRCTMTDGIARSERTRLGRRFENLIRVRFPASIQVNGRRARGTADSAVKITFSCTRRQWPGRRNDPGADVPQMGLPLDPARAFGSKPSAGDTVRKNNDVDGRVHVHGGVNLKKKREFGSWTIDTGYDLPGESRRRRRRRRRLRLRR